MAFVLSVIISLAIGTVLYCLNYSSLAGPGLSPWLDSSLVIWLIWVDKRRVLNHGCNRDNRLFKAAKVAYGILKMLHSGTEGMFCISIFVERIVLLGISLKVSRVLASQVRMESISKPVFVQFHLGRKALKLVDNHPEI